MERGFRASNRAPGNRSRHWLVKLLRQLYAFGTARREPLEACWYFLPFRRSCKDRVSNALPDARQQTRQEAATRNERRLSERIDEFSPRHHTESPRHELLPPALWRVTNYMRQKRQLGNERFESIRRPSWVTHASRTAVVESDIGDCPLRGRTEADAVGINRLIRDVRGAP